MKQKPLLYKLLVSTRTLLLSTIYKRQILWKWGIQPCSFPPPSGSIQFLAEAVDPILGKICSVSVVCIRGAFVSQKPLFNSVSVQWTVSNLSWLLAGEQKRDWWQFNCRGRESRKIIVRVRVRRRGRGSFASVHLPCIWKISPSYQFGTRVIPEWYQGDTRISPAVYQGDTRVIPGWCQVDTRCSPRCTCLASEKFPLHINTVLGWYQSDTRENKFVFECEKDSYNKI